MSSSVLTQAIPRALQATSDGIETVWIPTDSVGDSQSLAGFDGFWCVPGIPYRNADGAMRAIRHARITRTPFLGTSAGFQYAILEYARDVLGLSQADHQKTNPKSAMPLISPLGCALAGVKARVRFLDGSRLRRAYGAPESIEEYHCSFGLNGRYRRLIEGRTSVSPRSTTSTRSAPSSSTGTRSSSPRSSSPRCAPARARSSKPSCSAARSGSPSAQTTRQPAAS